MPVQYTRPIATHILKNGKAETEIPVCASPSGDETAVASTSTTLHGSGPPALTGPALLADTPHTKRPTHTYVQRAGVRLSLIHI